MIRAGVLMALLGASGVHAEGEGPQYDPQVLEACLLFEPVATQERCVGHAANRCMMGPGGGSTAAMGYCYEQERAQWDDVLNATYRALIAAEQSHDDEVMGLAPKPSLSLREMQRAWVGYRDTLCAYTLAQWGGGTGGGPAERACLMHETARQVGLLRLRLADAELP